MGAQVQHTPDGYVVKWQEEHEVYSLRCFGDYHSAAYEFRDMVNNYMGDDRDRRLKQLAASYDPKKKYSYPEPTKVGIANLKRQREWNENKSTD